VNAMTRLLRKAVVAGIFASAFAAPASAELVTNGGFENGMNSWTLAGQRSYSYIYDAGHSGNFALWLGSTDPSNPDSASQDLVTIPGATYHFEWYLAVGDPDWAGSETTPNEFAALWNGNRIFDQTDMPFSPYQPYGFDVVATGAQTAIEFEAYNVPNFFCLDDVSVSLVPEPGSIALLLIGAATFVAVGKRTHR
jgi:PEP-CTERM motif-containing protein